MLGYKIVREPFILLETVWMLYRYVNKLTFQQDLSEQKYLGQGAASEWTVRRMNRLQEITEEICGDLDIQDPELRRFFGNQEVGTTERVDTCLAILMTCSFTALREPSFHGTVEEICATWKRLQASGAWIQPDGGNLLQFSDQPGDHGDLFSQVRHLQLPAEFRLELYDALRHFDKTMEELVTLIEPLADRLEAMLREERWLLDEVVDYWQEVFQKTSAEEVLPRLLTGVELFTSDGTENGSWVVAVSLMLSRNLIWHTKQGSLISPDYNYAYIGCGLDNATQFSKRGHNLEQISVILKTLSDKKRLEVLQRLSGQSSYCYELADAMHVDYGNLSRTLSTLHNYGFLRQERGPTRNYYQTDNGAIHEFFQLVESIISK